MYRLMVRGSDAEGDVSARTEDGGGEGSLWMYLYEKNKSLRK